MFGWNERTGQMRGRDAHLYGSDASDDTSLARRMRETAVKLQANGRCMLRLSRGEVEEICSLNRRGEQLRGTCLNGGEALESFVQNARTMEACAVQAQLDCVKDLPASGGRARILTAVEAIVGMGDVCLTRDRLMLALASFDDVQALEMAELWAVPEAVRVCLSRAFRAVGGECLKIAENRRRAERWAAGEEVRLSGCGPVFYEHALQLANEAEEPELRRKLEQAMQREEISVEQAVQAAHARASVAHMRIENLAAGRRMLDSLDWAECFEQLSSVEAELRYDPSGTYPAMDDDSRAVVRREAAVIAQCMNVGELTVARHAVSAAQAARYEGKPESMHTVCYWIYDDDGRTALLERMGAEGKHIPKIVPDRSGVRSAWGIIVLFAAIYLVFQAAIGSIWLIFPGIPAAWCAATALIGRIYPRVVKPAKLLKMEINRVPDSMRTLVVMPALLSSVERAKEICDQIEALNCLERDKNIRALILGDFADSDEQHMQGDGEILDYVRSRISSMNADAGEEKYFYLHRERRLLEADGRWMGRDRKRGALMDLNRLLMGRQGSEAAFSAEGAACETLKNGYACVLTIDADTRFLPGSVQRLIGAMMHPMNAPRREGGVRRGYAVLQPQMEMMAGACVNRFVELLNGRGGLNTYPTSVSNFWQDVTGTGVFGGKGLYAVRPFMEALEGALPEGKILSHDMIEGTLARAALVSDVCFYDGFPPTLGSFMRRFHRWTRGDWQLLPQLLSAEKYPVDGKRLGLAARVRMLDNLIRSLHAPALLGILTTAVWLGNAPAFVAGMLFAFQTALMSLPKINGRAWKRALAELAILPVTAAYAADAVIRTLWRLAFTGRHLLDWVTSADSEKLPGGQALPCRVAVILMLPGLLLPGWAIQTVALAVLFAAGPEWIRDLEQTSMENVDGPDGKDAAVMLDLARDTWGFFARYVSEESNHLPPDNVQMDPDVGAARRTSPTNVGLYLMSCVAAAELELIDRKEMLYRISETIGTLQRMEKWRGHLYNWHDIDTLAPLSPRYVSSVDSGNLAAALLLCASAVEDAELSGQLRSLAERMDFAVLYDRERDLFAIGMDVEHERLSSSHYDLLASESRILSYTAMMLGAVPVRHWEKLSRTMTAVGRTAALVSWSGTMFEYLMPELFMHSPKHTLLGDTINAVIRAQMALGTARNRPWGVSESGYCAFDMYLNYQYRAFGLRSLSLGGNAPEEVVAPYASLLAAPMRPKEVVRNIERMQAAGWRREYGMVEAADYLHNAEDGQARIVASHMSHHQGMALCALCNALTAGSLNGYFMKIPHARALSLLLEERAAESVHLGHRQELRQHVHYAVREGRDVRRAKPEQRIADVHLLGGGGATVLVTADGAVHYERDGVQGTRFQGDLLNRNDGACVHWRRERTGEEGVLGNEHVQYEPGKAVFRNEMGPLTCKMTVCVSPEDGALLRKIAIRNSSDATESVRIADCVPVSLGRAADMLAHAAFRNLFVESKRIAAGAVEFRRRPREADENGPVLLHLVSTPGNVRCETDMEKLTGRMGSTVEAGGARWNMSDTVGTVLNPCSSLETVLTVPPNGQAEIHFAFGLAEAEDAGKWRERNFAESVCERSEQLAVMQATAMVGFLGLKPAQHQLMDRMAILLFDPHLTASAVFGRGGAEQVRRETLWSMGISGDLPVLLMSVHRKEEVARVRDAVRMHDFYRTMGLRVDLVLVNEHGNDYDQPVRDAISDAVAFSHLNDRRGQAGGVHILEGRLLSAQQREALIRIAAVRFDASRDFHVQIREALGVLNHSEKPYEPMETGLDRMTSMQQKQGNGYGMMLADNRFAIDVTPEQTTPAPWSNLMANDRFGVLLTERGGGFLWAENSRSGRLTPFGNDVLSEGWGWMFYLVNDEDGTFLRLLPGRSPMMRFRALYGPSETVYRFETERISGELAFCVRSDTPELRIHSTLRSSIAGEFRLVGFTDWLMGTDAKDTGMLRTWTRDGACFAAGTAPGIGYFAAANARVRPGPGRTAFLGRGGIQNPDGIGLQPGNHEGHVLSIPIRLQEDHPQRTDWVIGWAEEAQQAYARVRAFYGSHSYEEVRTAAQSEWSRRMNRLKIETPDGNLNALANGWLIHQSLTGRIRSRTGLYQPGGAYGFRDQLQDMLALLPFEPQRVREHILRCAAHQFEDGDVMHWWHEPYHGVRTRISDDLLFLPYVTAQYVKWTQDESVLDERVCYLKNVEIEEGKEDRYCEMEPGEVCETLHEHCMRAFRRASATGIHGLCLMGSGDWNDGMNRVGAEGRGESVWLTEFLAVCARDYAQCASDQEDKVWLTALSDRMCAAVEENGWDGEWYLRAYADTGMKLGSAECSVCRIDAISQAWAVFANLDEERCAKAMDAAWNMLADEGTGIIRLLTPPFDDDSVDPGYIRGYPAGVRENGAQYTHAACWVLLALIRMGNTGRAHRALQMLIPANHANTKKRADRYRVEPYVMAADIYDGVHAGRGGWTWYTGSAAWMYRCVLELLGFERWGNRVRLNALLGEWPEVAVTVEFGKAKYRLVCRKDVREISLDGRKIEGDWIEMIDDGQIHEAIFPPRQMNVKKENCEVQELVMQ